MLRSSQRLIGALAPALGGLTLSCLLLGGCTGNEPGSRDPGTRAVVIGIDGADWKLIDALVAEGRMPHLARLREQGVSGELETLQQIRLSPAIWTSVATAKTPEKHGISWFLVDLPDGSRAPVRSHNRKSKALWNIVAENDRRPTVIGWWATYPAEDVGSGALVSDAIGVHGFGATARDGDDGRKTHPVELYDAVRPLVPPEESISFDFARRFIHVTEAQYEELRFSPTRSPGPNSLNPIHLFQQYAATAEGYTSIAESLLDEPYDLFMVYFEQVDSFSHLFMKYTSPRLPWIDEARHERFRDVVPEWYAYQDELLGRLLAHIDLESTAVFVLSDHGFKSGERRIRSERVVDPRRAHLEHESEGIFIAAGPHIRTGEAIAGASVLDVAPTLLHYLGLPVASDMDGDVLEGLFEPSFLSAFPVQVVASYESDGSGHTESGGPPEDDPALVAEQLDGLRVLGYIDPESDAGATAESSSAEIHNNLGRIHLSKGETEQALREFEKALELDPHDADALLNMSALHRAAGRIAQAEQLVRRALQRDPNSVGALSGLAELKRDQGDLQEAARLFQEALRIDDSRPNLYMGLGDVLQRAGRFEDAERTFRAVLELDPDSYQAYYNLGATFGSQGRLDEAIAQYEKALELAPPRSLETAFAHNNLGAIYRERGATQDARKQFLAAVEASPVHLESRFNLAMLLLNQNEVAEAIALLEEAASLEPNHRLVAVQLGYAYLREGRDQDAFRSFLLVRRLYPEDWTATLGLALVSARAGKDAEARSLVEQAVRVGGAAAQNRASQFPILEPFVARD